MSAAYTLDRAKQDRPRWFAADATRFFGTRLHDSYPGPTACYVVTSEQPPHGPRTWNVRRFDADGEHTDTIGPTLDVGHGGHTAATACAVTLAQAEKHGAIQAHPDRGERFRPCAVCVEQEAEHPGWASFYTDAKGDVCAAHLAEAVEA